MNLVAPPVNELDVADFLGYEVKKIKKSDTENFPGVWDSLKTACAHLFRDKNLILIRDDMTLGRDRQGVFHEIGHDQIPSHRGLNYSCNESALTPIRHKLVEKEAFLCGNEIMMPVEWISQDILDLDISFRSISKIANRYQASFEATAIRYALTHPGICAIILVESNVNKSKQVDSFCGCHTHQLTLPVTCRETKPKEAYPFPLVVKYSVKSKAFVDSIRPGMGIRENNLLFHIWNSDKDFRGELPSEAFRMRKRTAYQAEIKILKNPTRMFILLWQNHFQRRLKYEYGNIITES